MIDKSKRITIVIPIFNENQSIHLLLKSIDKVKQIQNHLLEIILVDDGSSDESWLEVIKLTKTNKKIQGIRLRRNFGKSYALQAGFEHAKGDTIVTIDADLQDDPNEIPKLIKMINQGNDLITGWKIHRNDPFSKTFPSKVYNGLIRLLFKLPLHDINCGLKAYRAEVAKKMNLYGELHRLTPLIASLQGYRVAEVQVNHFPRKYGKSKYGWSRYFKGLLDLITFYLKSVFFEKPMLIFGLMGLALILSGVIGLLYLSVIWLMDLGPIGNRPLLLFSVLFVVSGIQLFSLGLLTDILYAQTKEKSVKNFITEILKYKKK